MADKNIFDKWDESVDVEGLAKDVQEAAENGTGSFKEVPHGEYEVEGEYVDYFHKMIFKHKKCGNTFDRTPKYFLDNQKRTEIGNNANILLKNKFSVQSAAKKILNNL